MPERRRPGRDLVTRTRVDDTNFPAARAIATWVAGVQGPRCARGSGAGRTCSRAQECDRGPRCKRRAAHREPDGDDLRSQGNNASAAAEAVTRLTNAINAVAIGGTSPVRSSPGRADGAGYRGLNAVISAVSVSDGILTVAVLSRSRARPVTGRDRRHAHRPQNTRGYREYLTKLVPSWFQRPWASSFCARTATLDTLAAKAMDAMKAGRRRRPQRTRSRTTGSSAPCFAGESDAAHRARLVAAWETCDIAGTRAGPLDGRHVRARRDAFGGAPGVTAQIKAYRDPYYGPPCARVLERVLGQCSRACPGRFARGARAPGATARRGARRRRKSRSRP